MMRCLWSLGSPLLLKLPPEKAHHLAITTLKTGLVGEGQIEHSCLFSPVAGLDFPNPLGLAAGFDKNGQVMQGVLRLGFGFAEIGSVTPRPQEGNEPPRLFRLKEDEAIINRMGFNNDGHDVVYQRLKERDRSGIIGINIGANKDCVDKIDDYRLGIHRFYDVADYFTVNISSPNTPGLRDLQMREALEELLKAVCAAREIEQFPKSVTRFSDKNCGKTQELEQFVEPSETKTSLEAVAPDLTEQALDDVAEIVQLSDCDGVIISNTTLARDGLISPYQTQAGGLSGKPLFELSTMVLAKMRQRIGRIIPIIGVGGITDASSALEKIRAGADLIQIYSAMVFAGPSLPSRILKDLIALCVQDGVSNIAQYRDQSVDQWANRSFEK